MVFDFIAQVLESSGQDRMIRGCAGNTLLDFKQNRYKKALVSFAKEDYVFHFSQEDVLRDLSDTKPHLDYHGKNWLSFYDEEEIEKRQQRWKRENSLREKLFGWVLRRWRFRKLWKELDKLLEDGWDTSPEG